MNEMIQTICIYAIPVLMAITMHEAAHAYAARHFGDFTAAALGRITLNPWVHIDWLGTVALPLIAVVSGLPVIGWAKAVPVNGRHFKQPRLAWRWVAAAGPLANLAMMLAWAIILKILILGGAQWNDASLFVGMAKAGIMVNVSLAVLNLLFYP
jgi:Zn-dependent protease